jgi:WD40 repeat protein
MGFAGAGRLLTQVHGNSHPQFDLWDVKTGQLLQHVTVEEAHGTPDVHDAWSISPGNRFLAVFLSRDMYLIDLNSGKVAARLAIPDARFSGPAHGVAFSPDGTRLAFYVSNSLSADASHRVQPRMLVWDLSNGKLIFSKAITLPLEFDESSRRSPYFNTPLQWVPDQKAWLLFGRLVVDIACGTVVY